MQPSLLGLARRITRDEDASADVVQRAFVKVLLHASRAVERLGAALAKLSQRDRLAGRRVRVIERVRIRIR